VSEKPYSKPSTASSDSAEFQRLEVGLLRTQVAQREIGFLGRLVDDAGVALGEGARIESWPDRRTG